MQQFKTVFLYEFRSSLKNKIFLGFTIVVAALILLLLTIPPVISNLTGGDSAETQGQNEHSPGTDTADAPVITVLDGAGIIADRQMFEQAMGGMYAVTYSDDITKEAILSQIEDETILAGVIIDENRGVTYIEDQFISSPASELVKAALQNQVLLADMREGGMSDAQITQAFTPLEFTFEQPGKSFTETYWYTYVLLILLYMTVNMYGQMVATSVVNEKSSRAMELLVSSAKPNNLMFGKILGVGLTGLLQISIWIVCAASGYLMNSAFWQGVPFVSEIFAMPPYILAFMILFYILGYFAFASLYGAVGSLVSRVEDINTVSLPVVFLFMAGFFVSIFGMTVPDSLLIKIFSFIPLYTPMCMFVRMCTSEVAPAEIIISIVLCAAFTYFACRLAARIYRLGVLMYGNAPKLGAVIKMLRQSKKY
ncbi:MAG TPA: hypothetical protein DEQ02_02345 [Ruminococcaceae bacterium]|nr:hypothetical protein [Oscillospiraceae bacterium]